MIALMGEGPVAPLHGKIKKLKKALRLVLRAAKALESERQGDGSDEDFYVDKAFYDASVAKAEKVLKEVS